MILLLNRQSTDLSCYSSPDCRKRIHEDADEAVNHVRDQSEQADSVDGESQQRLKGRNRLNGDNITKSTKWKKHKI